VSDTSWSTYLNLSTQPNKLGVAYTPYGMRRKNIEAWGCLCGVLVMGCFPFLCVGTLDFPTSVSLSSPPNFGFPVISSCFTSSCCADPTIGCDLGPSNSIISLSMSFVWWVASALDDCSGFPVADRFWPPAQPYESMSIMTIFGACLSFSTSVALTGSACGEGIASTLMIPPSCV
jgi:hypothetical protein